MATALQLSIDREHPELEDIEKHDQDNDRSSGSAYSQSMSYTWQFIVLAALYMSWADPSLSWSLQIGPQAW